MILLVVLIVVFEAIGNSVGVVGSIPSTTFMSVRRVRFVSV